MDPKLKKQIIITQIKLLKAIQSHKICFEKLENGNRSDELMEEMLLLKRQMLECQKEQNCLLEQLNSLSGAPFRFQLYDIPYSALQKKNNRRKALLPSVEPKNNEKVRELLRTPSPDMFLPADLQCSDESEVDDDDDVISSQPVPLPVKSSKPTHLLPKPTRRPRNYKSEPGPMKELPVYFDPPPSPEPTDATEAKNKYMRGLNLLTKDALTELLSKKNERKRRSTANSHYAYSKDYELPAVKRKQYLSPVKKSNEETRATVPEKKVTYEEEAESSKSPSPAPDIDERSLKKCKLCEKSDTLISCLDCNELFHAKCPAIAELERSFLTCRRCKCFKTPSCSDEAAVNFQAQDLSESDADSNGANFRATHMEGRIKIRDHLMKILRCRMVEKNQMESMVLQLSDNLHFQARMKNNLEENSKETMTKIDQLRNFVKLFQMQNGKDISPPSPMVVQEPAISTLPPPSQSDVDSLSQTSEDSLSIPSNSYLQEPLKKCIKLSY